MAARWGGQNSGPIFRRLWTKLHRVPVRECICSLQRQFPIDNVLLRSEDISKVPPKFLTEFYQSGHHRTLVTIGQVTSDRRWEKRKI